MGSRRDKIDKRNAYAISARRTNSRIKDAERNRREKTMLEILRQNQFPYTPGVMSWLSVHLDKKASQITPDDIKTILAQ